MAKTRHYEDLDGRVRTQYRITGADTFRTSTSLIDVPVRPDTYGLAFQTVTKHSEQGRDIRSMFIAPEGYALVEADQSQAESRIALLLAEEYKLLELMDKIDIHSLTASWINGTTYEIERARFESGYDTNRQLGKHSGHAYDNGVGKKKLVELVYHHSDGEIEISEWKAGKILDILYQYKPGIKNVFHKGIQQALEDNGHELINPWGARRTFFDRWGDELFKQAYAHIKQSTVTGLTQRAGMEITRNDWIKVLYEGHDALLFEIPVWKLQESFTIICNAFEQEIDFSRCSLPRKSLVIPCDIMVSLTNWNEMVKLKKWREINGI
jgi:hypothetical protein